MRALLLVLLLTGCAGQPYFELGAAMQVDEWTDWYLRSERVDSGSNPQFEGEFGIEWPTDLRCGVYHWSHLFDGGPFNSNDETYQGKIRCLYKWGGVKHESLYSAGRSGAGNHCDCDLCRESGPGFSLRPGDR